jgi:replicative DNA helicase
VQVSNDLSVLLNMPEINRDEISRALHMKAITINEDSSVTPGINGFVADFSQKQSGKYRFIDTGLSFLNMMLGGEWPRQGLSIVLGQAGGGKTALVCQSIVNMARLGIPSLFISLEMTKAKLVSRFVANMANIDGLKLRNGKVDEEDKPRIDAALMELQTLPIYIIDNPEMTCDDIVYQVRLHKELYGIEAFFVDYIQIVTRQSRNNDDLVEELGYIAQRFRNVAKMESLAAVVLSQQNRQFKGLQSILGSGRIGHIADTAFEIKLEDSPTNDDSRTCMLDFHKNRDGPVGEAICTYRPRYLRFE